MGKVLIAPSLLAADFLHLEEAARLVNDHADIFHLDVMDGTFVPNISFGFPVVEALRPVAKKPMDVHLMIVHPEKYIERFAKAGASMISFHEEAAEADGSDPAEILRSIRSFGVSPGLVVNPDIPAEKLFPYLELCDFVLIMSVFAGFGGQKFIESSYEKIRAVRKEILRRGLDVKIEVDGGVGPSNAAALADAGAEILVAGSSVFKAADPAAAVAALRGQSCEQV